MLEQIFSVQDILGMGIVVGVLLKFYQFLREAW